MVVRRFLMMFKLYVLKLGLVILSFISVFLSGFSSVSRIWFIDGLFVRCLCMVLMIIFIVKYVLLFKL